MMRGMDPTTRPPQPDRAMPAPPAHRTPNPDREAGDALHGVVSSVLAETLALSRTLTVASNHAPHVRLAGRSIGVVAGEVANLWSLLDGAHRAYIERTTRR